MSRWSLFFLTVPVAGVAVFAAGEYLGWSLPPLQSTHGAQLDHLYYVILAITGVAFIFTQLGLAFLVYYYRQSTPGTTVRRRDGWWSLAAWLVVPLAGFGWLLYVFPMPPEARLWMAIALCVGWPLLLSLLTAGRHARGAERAVYSHGSAPLEIVWTVVPAIIFLFIAAYQYPLWREMRYPRAKPADVVPVRVIGRQFEWRMVYAGPDQQLDTEDDVYVPGELHVIKGAESWIDLRSMDVIHSFFLPFHRVKQDAVPGLSIPVWFDCAQSTWENQSRQAIYLPEDLFDTAGIARLIGKGGTPALAYLKEKLGAEVLNSATAGSLVLPLNRIVTEPGFYAAGEFANDDSLPSEVRRLAALQSDEPFRMVLNRKLLDQTLGSLVQPIGGEFDIVCAELCGWGHYKMKGRLFVHETAEDFQAWMDEQVKVQESVR